MSRAQAPDLDLAACWLSVPRGESMRRINLYAYFDCGGGLRTLKNLQTGEARRGDLVLPDVVLWRLLNDPIFKTLPSSRAQAVRLSESLANAYASDDMFDNSILEDGVLSNIKGLYSTFETFLAEELTRANVYAVDPKGIFETDALVNRASEAIPPKLLKVLPAECANDLQQAGRCLAFELPTAAGFHIMRATEAAIWKYWDKAVGKKVRPTSRNWGSAIKDLEGGGADARITAALRQLKDLHRNPVVHPEVTLDMDEALALWQVAPGAIIAIARELAK